MGCYAGESPIHLQYAGDEHKKIHFGDEVRQHKGGGKLTLSKNANNQGCSFEW
ncbi:hypothetical protein EZS27_013710 [termite gut metagenome]|uniref:Uncharacterized protein n=1 Tax=termite gut metagenome TaxID=433724 RepID=A0A5J4RYY3_9ZZZZ